MNEKLEKLVRDRTNHREKFESRNGPTQRPSAPIQKIGHLGTSSPKQVRASSSAGSWARAIGAVLLLGGAVSLAITNWPLRPHACAINAGSRLVVAPIAGTVQDRDHRMFIFNEPLETQLMAEVEQLKAQARTAEDELSRARREAETVKKAKETAHSGAEDYLRHWRAYLEKGRAEAVNQRDSAAVELERAKRQAKRGAKLVDNRNITATEMDQLHADTRSAELRRDQFQAEVEKHDALIQAVDEGHIVDREAPMWQAFESQLDLRLETLASVTLPFLESQAPHREKPLLAVERAVETKCLADVGAPMPAARLLVKPGQFVASGAPLYEEPAPFSTSSPYVLTAVFSDRAHPRVGDRVDVEIVGWDGAVPQATIVEIRPATKMASHGFFDELEIRQDQVLAVGTLDFASHNNQVHAENGQAGNLEAPELVGRHARLRRPWSNSQNNFALLGACACGLLCVAVPLSRKTR